MSSLTPEQLSYFQAHADDTLQPNEIAANVCGYVFAVIAVSLRIIARKISMAKFGLDDYFIVAAMVCISQLISIHRVLTVAKFITIGATDSVRYLDGSIYCKRRGQAYNIRQEPQGLSTGTHS